MKKIMILIVLSITLTGCANAEKKAFDLAVEKLESMYTLGNVDAYKEDSVNLVDVDDDPSEHFYSVDVIYEAKTKAGTMNRFSTWCTVPKNAKSYFEVSCYD